MDHLNETQTTEETIEVRQEIGLSILCNIAAFNISILSSPIEIGR